MTGGGRNAISEWTTITSRVIEPASASQCKSNIGCCDTYVVHTSLFIAISCGRASENYRASIDARRENIFDDDFILRENINLFVVRNVINEKTNIFPGDYQSSRVLILIDP